jgi:FHS family L-fucose permease-like MFS transporter
VIQGFFDVIFSQIILADLLAIAQCLYAFNRFVCYRLDDDEGFQASVHTDSLFDSLHHLYDSCHDYKSLLVAMIIFVLCFESVSNVTYDKLSKDIITNGVIHQCCFATIFSLAFRSLGRHTKRGGSLLVAAISGGMVFPPMMGAIVVRCINFFSGALKLWI